MESKLRLTIHEPSGKTFGSVVPASDMLQIFSDGVTEILAVCGIWESKLETLDAQFPGILLFGEFVEVEARYSRAQGQTWYFECLARKVLSVEIDSGRNWMLKEPILVAKATARAHIPLDSPFQPLADNVVHLSRRTKQGG